jgi:anaphase-promoting complex subunit 11
VIRVEQWLMTFKIHVKRWHIVGNWTWDAGDDVCGICRNPFDGCPPDGKYPGDDSPVVWGVCGHALHLQCITKWLQQNQNQEQKCPLCRRAWEFKSMESAGEPAAVQDQSVVAAP